jgi:hypothetical protein
MEFSDIMHALLQCIQPVYDISEQGCNQRIELSKVLYFDEQIYLL